MISSLSPEKWLWQSSMPQLLVGSETLTLASIRVLGVPPGKLPHPMLPAGGSQLGQSWKQVTWSLFCYV